MKRILKVIALGILTGQMALAGGIVTNTNQSASWVRMLSRDASTDIDAIYYNPAGITALGEGIHFSLSNQSIVQEYQLYDDYPSLNDGYYTGDVSAPIFPNFYASYNSANWAFFLGFGVVGGGGSAEYTRGMPSFETPISHLPALISDLGVPTSAYSVEQYFDGTSAFYGIQGGASYKINEMISASAGLRYVIASNHYSGYLLNVQVNPTHPTVNPSGEMMSAEVFFTSLGLPSYAAMVADKEVKTTQTARGITPILGLNISPNENLNIGLKWEGNTSLEFENDTEVDGTGMFSDGSTFNRDMPMMISVGVQYKLDPNVRIQAGYHTYMDKNADWDGREDLVDHNMYELSVGAEYDINHQFTISAGYLMGRTGVSENYQDNLSFSLSSNTLGGGLKIHFNEALSLDLGFAKMMYMAMVEHVAADPSNGTSAYNTNYDKDGFMLAIGLNYSLY